MVSMFIPPEAATGKAVAVPVPAPTLGLNTREHFTDLQANEARELVNWLPGAGSCKLRAGYEPWCNIAPVDGLMVDERGYYWADELGALMGVTAGGSGTGLGGSPILTLARYLSGATRKMIAASGGSLYEVLGGTAISLATGYSRNLWSCHYFNQYLFGVNGVDTPWRYDGSVISATGWTGPSSLSQLRSVRVIGDRLWLTKLNSGDVYYGGSMLITGALTLFAASQIADGGHCLGVFPWRGNVAMAFSTGQVLLYQGDPATTFSLVASYYAPPLVDYDAAVEMGGELVLMTIGGPISMDVVAAGLAFNLEALGNWGKIAPSWKDDVINYHSNEGWFGKFINGVVYFNIPNGTNPPKQYVFNTRNQAWCTYEGLPIASMENIDELIYLGSNNSAVVYLHTGGLDNGAEITARGRPGFSYFSNPGNNKMISRVKPSIVANGSVLGQFAIDADFETQQFSGPIYDIGARTTGTNWGAPWGSPWATKSTNDIKWIGVAAKGRALSPICQIFSRAQSVEWFATDVLGRMMGPT
jgi:hypothetical protein